MKIIFEGKRGIFGEKGWERVSFWTWLKLVDGRYTQRVRMQKKKKYIPPPELPL